MLLIDILFQFPVSTHESLIELSRFVSRFCESLSLLKELNIPNLGSFILFSMAFRCLPNTTRELFENTITSSGDYPTIEALLTCVKSRLSTLKIISGSILGNFSSQSKSSRPSNRKGDRSSNSGHQHATSIITTKPERSCPYSKALGTS